MPDIHQIDPAALSRISTTPILPPKSIGAVPASIVKQKQSNHVPPRIDLEPLYTALKSAIGEYWGTYKSSVGLFIMGQMNQAELSDQIDGFLVTPTGEIEHLHNQLISGIYANLTRECPEIGVATWVSANDKPAAGAGSKPVSGDAAEQRLKVEIMQLPNRDRRRLKDLAQNDFDPQDPFANVFGDSRRPKAPKPAETIASSAGGLNKTNWDLEIRKRYAQPLACESGEFPDPSSIEARMLPICFETGLVAGHSSDAAQFMSVATETFLKEVLSSVFSKTRSNGPGASGSAGTGGGASWIQTHKYRVQLEKEEEGCLRGEIQRDKNGLLQIEAKAALERGPLGMADVRTALELGDCGLGQMPVVVQQIMLGYREGEAEAWEDYSWPEHYVPAHLYDRDGDADIEMGGMNGTNGVNGVNGVNGHYNEADDEWGWEGVETDGGSSLDNLLDSCLAVGA